MPAKTRAEGSGTGLSSIALIRVPPFPEVDVPKISRVPVVELTRIVVLLAALYSVDGAGSRTFVTIPTGPVVFPLGVQVVGVACTWSAS
jgi:hypothetical protein